METKTNTEVFIGGKSYKLSGYEKEYLQRVAAYLNDKIEECNTSAGYKRLSVDMQALLLELNVADDYFKAKDMLDKLEEEVKQKDKEIYDIKHELITAQIKSEGVDKSIKALEDQLHEEQKKVVRLETELNSKTIK